MTRRSIVTSFNNFNAAAKKPLLKHYHTRAHTRRIKETGIKEIDTIHDLLKHVCSDTFVVCDIDETLMYTQSYMGRSRWFDTRIQGKPDRELAVKELIPFYNEVQLKAPVAPMEDITHRVIEAVSNNSSHVIGLTARGSELSDSTHKQLASIGIKLDRVLFVGGYDKGPTLENYLSENGHKPKRIVCIDDKVSHINRIKNVADRLGIEFLGLHYTPKISPIHDYCHDSAEIQAKHFIDSNGEILRNNDAKAKLVGNKRQRLVA